MANIIVEEATGSSEDSLSDALAKALKSALKAVNGNHKLNMTVIVDGYAFEQGRYEVSVKVVIMDITLEEEKAIHDSEKEFEKRMHANEDLSNQIYAATYNKGIYDNTDTMNELKNEIEHMAGMSDQFDFNAEESNVTVVASESFQNDLRADLNMDTPQQNLEPQAPALGPGGGSGATGETEDK
jgi:hypothetical protein